MLRSFLLFLAIYLISRIACAGTSAGALSIRVERAPHALCTFLCLTCTRLLTPSLVASNSLCS